MRIIIYESSSFGGCYEYLKFLYPAYLKNPAVESCKIILPENTAIDASEVYKILWPDKLNSKNKLYRKGHFLLRNIFDPFILFKFLLREKKSVVIFNDFEQISAPIWVPFFKIFLKKHRFAVVLHDPDRDTYPPSKTYSGFCMRIMMSIMDFALYHDFLPDKSYYSDKVKTHYFSVPHGLYPKTAMPDEDLLKRIGKQKPGLFMAILGNIRAEKNYLLAINVLTVFPNVKLIIAGAPSNSSVDIEIYKKAIKENKVENQVIWIEKFLTDEELASVIKVSDLILLNYAKTFTSQSGILNLIAPYQKPVIFSDAPSSLSYLARKYKLGIEVEADNLNSLIEGIRIFMAKKNEMDLNWDAYIKYASWKRHAEIAVTKFRKKL